MVNSRIGGSNASQGLAPLRDSYLRRAFPRGAEGVALQRGWGAEPQTRTNGWGAAAQTRASQATNEGYDEYVGDAVAEQAAQTGPSGSTSSESLSLTEKLASWRNEAYAGGSQAASAQNAAQPASGADAGGQQGQSGGQSDGEWAAGDYAEDPSAQGYEGYGDYGQDPYGREASGLLFAPRRPRASRRGQAAQNLYGRGYQEGYGRGYQQGYGRASEEAYAARQGYAPQSAGQYADPYAQQGADQYDQYAQEDRQAQTGAAQQTAEAAPAASADADSRSLPDKLAAWRDEVYAGGAHNVGTQSAAAPASGQTQDAGLNTAPAA